MCGRFVGFRRLERLPWYFPIDVAKVDFSPDYIVSPRKRSSPMPVVTNATICKNYLGDWCFSGPGVPVSKQANSAQNNRPEYIKPVDT